jgi:uncharacterized damage-inducible protein DinB
MSIAQALLPEFDQEIRTTRALLERFPEAQAAWRPHPKSMALGQLAMHASNILTWMTHTLTRTELDLHPPGGEPLTSPEFKSKAAMLELLDRNAAEARAALAGASDADMLATWTLKKGGQTVLSLPRAACVRSFVLNHHIHHRGQLSVYLRLQDVPLPSMYGPTADTAG